MPHAALSPPEPTDQLLFRALLNLPFAAAEVLGTFAGIVRQQAHLILANWEEDGWVQSLHPACLGRSRQRLYAATARGLRRWAATETDLLRLATVAHLDPVGLVRQHLPRLLRRQTAYRVAASIVAQAYRDHPLAHLSWRVELDGHYDQTVDYASLRRRGPTTRRLVVPSDLVLEVTVREGEHTTWERAQVWLDDGLMAPPRLQARVQVLADASRHDPVGTPQTFIIVRDLARLGMWQTAIDAVLQHGGLLPGALCLLPVPWPWPLSCGGQPAPARPWQEQWVRLGRQGIGGIALPPLAGDRWRARAVPFPFGVRRIPVAPPRILPAWRLALLTDPVRVGTIAEARAVLQHRSTQMARHATLVARWCLGELPSVADEQRAAAARPRVVRERPQLLGLLACIAAMPLVTRADLAQLMGVTPTSLAALLAPLHVDGLVDYLTPRAGASLPTMGTGDVAPLAGVRLTEAGQRLLAAFYPQPLAVYRRATRVPRAHDSGVARFFTLFEGWLRTLEGVSTLWWWTGPTLRLRAFHEGRRSTAYPDAMGTCVVEERRAREAPRVRTQTLLLEWDMGHERRAAWEAKAAKYVHWIAARLHNGGVLMGDTATGWYLALFVVAPTERQAAMIAEVLDAAWDQLPRHAAQRCRAYVTTFAQLEQDFFGLIWTVIGIVGAHEPPLLDVGQMSAATVGGIAWPPTLREHWTVAQLDAAYAQALAEDAARRARWQQSRG